jgi:hypothetical protein
MLPALDLDQDEPGRHGPALRRSDWRRSNGRQAGGHRAAEKLLRRLQSPTIEQMVLDPLESSVPG